jgi:hypothetical protein
MPPAKGKPEEHKFPELKELLLREFHKLQDIDKKKR